MFEYCNTKGSLQNPAQQCTINNITMYNIIQDDQDDDYEDHGGIEVFWGNKNTKN